ncbi:MAG: hypothetical protein WCI74_18795 [Actinomycetes bacterium]
MPSSRASNSWLVTRDGQVIPARIRWGHVTGFRRLRDQFKGYLDISVWLLAAAGIWIAIGVLIGIAADLRTSWWYLVVVLALASSGAAVALLLARRGVRRTKHHPVFALVANRDVAAGAAELAVVASGDSMDNGRNRRYRIVLQTLNTLAPQAEPDPLMLRLFLSDTGDLRRRWVPDVQGAQALPDEEDTSPDVIDLTEELLGDGDAGGDDDFGSMHAPSWLRHHPRS